MSANPQENGPADPNEGKIPPHDLNAEASLLSAIFIAGSAVRVVEPYLLPEHFYSEAHRQIYAAMLDCLAAQSPIDTTTVLTRLRDNERLEQVGGAAYVTELLMAAPSIAESHVGKYAEIIYENWRLRTMLAAAQRITAKIYVYRPGPEDIQGFLEEATRKFDAITRAQILSKSESNLDVLTRIVKGIGQKNEQTQDARITGIPTGFHAYDVFTGGLHAQDVTLAVAHPGFGKTTWLLQVGVHVAKQGIGVMIFEGDMTRDQLLLKAISLESRVPMEAIRQGSLSDEQWERVHVASRLLAEIPLFIDDQTEITVDEIRSKTHAFAQNCRRLHGVPLGLVGIDYIQKLKPPPRLDRMPEHAQIMQSGESIKKLAKEELKIPFVVLAQHAGGDTDPKTRKRRLPKEDDIQGCKRLRACADLLFYLHRNRRVHEMTGADQGEDPDRLAQMLFKQRMGRCNKRFQYKLEGDIQRFVCLDDNATPPEDKS